MGKESEKNKYVYNWIGMLCTWNQHKTVNQLYSNIIFLKDFHK